MNSGGEIRGFVVDSDGLPLAGVSLYSYRGAPGFDQRRTTTDEDGSYRIPRLAAGTHIVILNYVGTGSGNQRIKTVELREGQVKEQNFTVGTN